ncbi:unnamed protein product [Schistosoma turkestanicum]|nr:unnamed protein product [Schistosoma turkestanicum]
MVSLYCFLLINRNKNRQLHNTQINNSLTEFDSSCTMMMNSTSQVTNMIHSYRLPMFPTLLTKSENIQNYYYKSGEQRTSDIDDTTTDSNKSHITLASIVSNSNNSAKFANPHRFNDQLINKLSSNQRGESVNFANLNSTENKSDNRKKHDLMKKDVINSKEMNLFKNEIDNSCKSKDDDNNNHHNGANDLTNRVRHIDKLFCELSRKMVDNLDAATRLNLSIILIFLMILINNFKNTTEHHVQKSNTNSFQQSHTSRISQIFTKANQFSAINLTTSLFRNASKERSRRKFV